MLLSPPSTPFTCFDVLTAKDPHHPDTRVDYPLISLTSHRRGSFIATFTSSPASMTKVTTTSRCLIPCCFRALHFLQSHFSKEPPPLPKNTSHVSHTKVFDKPHMNLQKDAEKSTMLSIISQMIICFITIVYTTHGVPPPPQDPCVDYTLTSVTHSIAGIHSPQVWRQHLIL